MKIDIPDEVLRVLYGIVAESVMPRYQALAVFERALAAAQEPPPAPPPNPEAT